MNTIGKSLRITAAAAVFAAAIYVVLSVPGFLSDRDSTVAVQVLRATRR